MEQYTKRIAQDQRLAHSMHRSFDTLDEQKAWFASLCSAICIYNLAMFNHIHEDGTEYENRFMPQRLRRYRPEDAKSTIKCEFALINDSVYFASKEKPNDVFEKNAPALIQEIRNKQDQINQVKASRSKTTNSEISAEEKEKTRVIESLRREISANDENIQKLQRIKLFGKKKAQTEIAMLNENNEKKMQQIEAVRKEIATIQDAQQMMIQEKLAEIDDQLCSLQQKMSALDQQKAEFMKSIPKWVFIGGTEQQ